MLEIISYNSYGELEVAWKKRVYRYPDFPPDQLRKLRNCLRFRNYRNAVKILRDYNGHSKMPKMRQGI